MDNNRDVLKTVRSAFAETITLKLRQLYAVVPKGSNSALTGGFVEELVRGFIKDWIAPCLLLTGTLHPHDANAELPAGDSNPKQIDGLVFDPRMGPAIIREGNFLVAHPAFCRGIIEIRTSEGDLREFEQRLQGLYAQYFAPGLPHGTSPSLNANHVMGIVIHDPAPSTNSVPAWLSSTPIHRYWLVGHCPIFILFRKEGEDYEPYEPGIDALIKAIFRSSWQHATHEDRLGSGPDGL